MRLLVTGATGLIGRPLCRALEAGGHAVTVVTRQPGRGPLPTVSWSQLPEAIRAADAVVNLAGEPIAAARWTAARKAEIRRSRLDATRRIVDAAAAGSPRPAVLVNASAIGYYGDRGDEPLDEESSPGSGFLAEVCTAWEAEARRAEQVGWRVVALRIGVVLAPDGGALAKMLPPFRAFLGGSLGGGRQWLSWVHRDDVVGLVEAALASDAWRGAVNATAPAPATNRDFSTALGHVLGRPSFLNVPAVVLRLGLGEMADMLLAGQRVLPRAAERLGYRFRYPELTAALSACVRA